MIDPNCYKCKFRRNVPGDAHSSCAFRGQDPMTLFFNVDTISKLLKIMADPHGIEMGWFVWPINFDPVWIRHCYGFTYKSPEQDGTILASVTLKEDLGNARVSDNTGFLSIEVLESNKVLIKNILLETSVEASPGQTLNIYDDMNTVLITESKNG